MDLTVGIASLGGVVVARVAGDLDHADEFRTRVRVLWLAAAPRVILDLIGVTFLDARGMAALVEVAQQVNHYGGPAGTGGGAYDPPTTPSDRA